MVDQKLPTLVITFSSGNYVKFHRQTWPSTAHAPNTCETLSTQHLSLTSMLAKSAKVAYIYFSSML